jgi:muramoyltetrapeptide carboxypeptidase
MQKLRKPPSARPGDTVGIYSPSSGIEPALEANYERGKIVLVERGYRVREAPHTREWQAHYSSDGASKSADLMNLFRDPAVKVILPTVGGTTAYQLLPHLEFAAIGRLSPKMLFGFSDNSLQACVIHDKTGLVTFHGHCDVVFGLGDLADNEKMKGFSRQGAYTSSQFFDALEGRLQPGPVAKATSWRVLRDGVAQGRLLGGNLDVLQILRGTPHELDWNDSIFFWEAAFIELHRVDLMLASLALAGVLGKLRGMLVGKGGNLEERFFAERHETLEEMILRHCAPYDFPIVIDADIGHDVECCVLPIGVLARLEGDTLSILETPYA